MSSLKKINAKQFHLGAFYIAPWKFSERKPYEAAWITIEDGSLVVLLDVEKCVSEFYTDYKLRVLTTEGEVADIYSTVAGLDYWKLAKNSKKK